MNSIQYWINWKKPVSLVPIPAARSFANGMCGIAGTYAYRNPAPPIDAEEPLAKLLGLMRTDYLTLFRQVITSSVEDGILAVEALANVSMKIDDGMIASLIGPNGAGKTTLFNTLTGLYKPDQGEIRFQMRSLVGLTPDRITSAGISRTFQNIRLFSQMTRTTPLLRTTLHFLQILFTDARTFMGFVTSSNKGR